VWIGRVLASRSSLSLESLLWAYTLCTVLDASRCRVAWAFLKGRPIAHSAFHIACIPGAWYAMSRHSMSASLSHFVPRCRRKIQRSDANHAETAARPNEVKAVKTDVKIDVA
jgi:hypothetical protein